MDKDAVTYWRFMNTPGVNNNHVWSGRADGHHMGDSSGILEIQVNWIDGKPYCKGYPGSECTPTGRVHRAELGPPPTPDPRVSPPPAPTVDPWAKQVDGSHYKDLKIQPFEFSMANNLDPMRHTIIKYVVRRKGDMQRRLIDLEKAKHTIDLLIQWEKDNATPNA